MSTIPKDKLDKLIGRWNAIQAELNAGAGQAVYTKLTKEFAALNPIVVTVEALRAQGYLGALTLVADEADLPYERPPLSKAYLQGAAPFEKAVEGFS